MTRKTKGSSSSGSPRGGRPLESKHAARERSSSASKPRSKGISKTTSKAAPKPPADDGEAVWVAPYHLRPASRAALLAALPPLSETNARAALEALERHLAQFVAFKRAGEFERHATPTGETRRRLGALRDAAEATLRAAADLAAAAGSLEEEDRDRLGLARHHAQGNGREGLPRSLREVAAELRDAERAPTAEHVAKAAALRNVALYALSELSSERPHGRGPKPDLAAEFLVNQAAAVWEEVTGKAPTRGRGDTPSPFERFTCAVLRVAGVRIKGDKLARKLVKVWPAVRAFRALESAPDAPRSSPAK